MGAGGAAEDEARPRAPSRLAVGVAAVDRRQQQLLLEGGAPAVDSSGSSDSAMESPLGRALHTQITERK